SADFFYTKAKIHDDTKFCLERETECERRKSKNSIFVSTLIFELTFFSQPLKPFERIEPLKPRVMIINND
ncbi:MAG: hypothetical protein NT127_03765, partial [Sphingobacteriales bacterium]|nr:hypothetical protein [Sphingobacteriales bacterium]